MIHAKNVAYEILNQEQIVGVVYEENEQ